MNTPISVTIKNLRPRPQTIHWTAKDPVYLPAGGSVDIPYEPWSCADQAQAQDILAATHNKSVAFVLHVAGPDGTVTDLDYDPSVILKAPRKAAAPAPVAEEKKDDTEIKPEKRDAHVKIAGENETAKGLGFKAEAVKAPETAVKKDAKKTDGFETTKPEASGVVTTDVLEKKADEKPAAEAAEDPVKAEFAKFIDEKRWDDALQLLIGQFGAEKVTFTTRVIMAMKDYDAIVAKYKLA